MEHKPVKSSNIESVGYDAESRTMQVKFSGGSPYEYDDVPPEKHHGLVNASSPGRYFASEIRNKFKGRKV